MYIAHFIACAKTENPMKVKGIALPVIIFTVCTIFAVVCVFCAFGKSQPAKIEEAFASIKSTDADTSQKLLALIEQQQKNTEKTLENQVRNNIQLSLQTLKYRIKGDFEGFINVAQHLAWTNATEKINLDSKQRKNGYESTLPLRFFQQIQYLPAAHRDEFFFFFQQEIELVAL
jgi:hypothetical protein